MLAYTAMTRALSSHPQWSAVLSSPGADHCTTLPALITTAVHHGACTGEEPLLKALLHLSGEATGLAFSEYYDQLSDEDRSAIATALSPGTGQGSREPGLPAGARMEEAPVIRARLTAEKTHPAGEDPLGRSATGWREGLTDQELSDRARGPWRADPSRVVRSKLLIVTNPDDLVVLVSTINSISMVDERVVIDNTALPGHSLLGEPDPLSSRSFNPIAGGTISVIVSEVGPSAAIPTTVRAADH